VDDGPSPEEAQEDFAKGKRAIDTLLKVRGLLSELQSTLLDPLQPLQEVPKLSTAAEGATKVALDAAKVQ
jgi:hypothetical protein